MIFSNLLISILALASGSFSASRQNVMLQDENFSVKTQYDKLKDVTSVRVGPMIVHGHNWELPEFRLSAFYTYSGKTPANPQFVTVAVDTLVNPNDGLSPLREKPVTIIVDGNRFSLGMMNLVDSRVGKKIALELWTINISTKLFQEIAAKLATSKKTELYLATFKIELEGKAMNALIDLQKKLRTSSSIAPRNRNRENDYERYP